jgi:hypothetical protein
MPAVAYLSGDNQVDRRFASINCYHFCLSPGNTGIRPSSGLPSSLRSAPEEFTRTISHRVAQGYRSANGIVLVSGTQALGVSVGTAPTGRARPRTPPGGRPHQRNGSIGSPAIRCPSPTTRLHRLAAHRCLPSPPQCAAAGARADGAATFASGGFLGSPLARLVDTRSHPLMQQIYAGNFRNDAMCGRPPSRLWDPWPALGSRWPRDPARPPGPAGNRPGGLLRATPAAMAVAGWSAPAARGGRIWASACPGLSPRSIAVTGVCVDTRASVERLGADLCATAS